VNPAAGWTVHFGRIIVAQAVTEDLLIVTADNLIRRYPVFIVW